MAPQSSSESSPEIDLSDQSKWYGPWVVSRVVKEKFASTTQSDIAEQFVSATRFLIDHFSEKARDDDKTELWLTGGVARELYRDPSERNPLEIGESRDLDLMLTGPINHLDKFYKDYAERHLEYHRQNQDSDLPEDRQLIVTRVEDFPEKEDFNYVVFTHTEEAHNLDQSPGKPHVAIIFCFAPGETSPYSVKLAYQNRRATRSKKGHGRVHQDERMVNLDTLLDNVVCEIRYCYKPPGEELGTLFHNAMGAHGNGAAIRIDSPETVINPRRLLVEVLTPDPHRLNPFEIPDYITEIDLLHEVSASLEELSKNLDDVENVRFHILWLQAIEKALQARGFDFYTPPNIRIWKKGIHRLERAFLRGGPRILALLMCVPSVVPEWIRILGLIQSNLLRELGLQELEKNKIGQIHRAIDAASEHLIPWRNTYRDIVLPRTLVLQELVLKLPCILDLHLTRTPTTTSRQGNVGYSWFSNVNAFTDNCNTRIDRAKAVNHSPYPTLTLFANILAEWLVYFTRIQGLIEVDKTEPIQAPDDTQAARYYARMLDEGTEQTINVDDLLRASQRVSRMLMGRIPVSVGNDD